MPLLLGARSRGLSQGPGGKCRIGGNKQPTGGGDAGGVTVGSASSWDGKSAGLLS